MDMNFHLDTEQGILINNQFKESKQRIVKISESLINDFERLRSCIDSTQITGLCNSIGSALGEYKESIGQELDKLTNFMDSQFKTYSNIYDEANKLLVNALNFIENSF